MGEDRERRKGGGWEKEAIGMLAMIGKENELLGKDFISKYKLEMKNIFRKLWVNCSSILIRMFYFLRNQAPSLICLPRNSNLKLIGLVSD